MHESSKKHHQSTIMHKHMSSYLPLMYSLCYSHNLSLYHPRTMQCYNNTANILTMTNCFIAESAEMKIETVIGGISNWKLPGTTSLRLGLVQIRVWWYSLDWRQETHHEISINRHYKHTYIVTDYMPSSSDWGFTTRFIQFFHKRFRLLVLKLQISFRKNTHSTSLWQPVDTNQ